MDKRRSDTFLQFFKREFEYGLRTNKNWVGEFDPASSGVNVTDRVPLRGDHRIITMESLILAQDER